MLKVRKSNQLPDGVSTNVQPPYIGATQRVRQQVVNHLAQEVYMALLDRVHGLRDQLKMVTMWRDIVTDLGDTAGVVKIHDLLIKAIGENGPLLLSHYDS